MEPYLIRIKDKIINLVWVKAIMLGEGIVVVDDGSPQPLAFAIPEAGIRAGYATTPITAEELARLISFLGNSFPDITTLDKDLEAKKDE